RSKSSTSAAAVQTAGHGLASVAAKARGESVIRVRFRYFFSSLSPSAGTCHSLIVRSKLAEARYWLSAENATPLTRSLCPFKDPPSPPSASQTFSSPCLVYSPPPEASSRPLGLNATVNTG